MEKTKTKAYTYFIGTDISKDELDHAVMRGDTLLFHREIKNTPAEISAFIEELKRLPRFTMTKAAFVMEHTGVYSVHLMNCLKKVKANIVVEPALQIKNSSGTIRGKYDKVDAIRIAEYAYRARHALRLITFKRPIIAQLSELNTLKNRLLRMQLGLKVPMKEAAGFIKKAQQKKNLKLCSGSLAAIKKDLEEIESCIQQTIKSDEHIQRLMNIATSVSCIGPVTALQIILCTNEFKDIRDPKKFACYSGVAPFHDNSGKIERKPKVSHIANKKMKSLLHICAMSAIRYDSELKYYYERKTTVEGKNKMSTLNAIRYKLILRVFACVNQNRYYEKQYQRPLSA